MVVAELASESVGAGAVGPELGAFFFTEMFTGGEPDKFVVSVGELALVAVVAEADGGVFFAEFGFVFEGIGFGEGVEVVFVVPFLAAVTFCG